MAKKTRYKSPENDWKTSIRRVTDLIDNTYHYEATTRKEVESWIKANALPGDEIMLWQRSLTIKKTWKYRKPSNG